MPIPNTRIEGAISGQFDYADALPVEAFDRLKSQENVEPIILKPFGWPVFVVNAKQGMLANLACVARCRAALNFEDMLAAAFGSTDFYSLDGAMVPGGLSPGTREAGAETYRRSAIRSGARSWSRGGLQGRADPHPDEPAVRLPLQDGAGRGRVSASAAGFAVDLQVVDWATLTSAATIRPCGRSTSPTARSCPSRP